MTTNRMNSEKSKIFKSKTNKSNGISRANILHYPYVNIKKSIIKSYDLHSNKTDNKIDNSLIFKYCSGVSTPSPILTTVQW